MPLWMVKHFIDSAIEHADAASSKVDNWAQENASKLGNDVADDLESKAESLKGDADDLATEVDEGASLTELLETAGDLAAATAELLTEAAAAAAAAGIVFA